VRRPASRRLPARRRTEIVLAALGCALAAVVLCASAHSSSSGSGSGRGARLQPIADRQIAPAFEARIGRETGGRLTTIHFYSEALHKRADYLVYLPSDYTPSTPLPVFYLLHGMPGKPVAFTVNATIEVRLEQLIRERRAAPTILVFPDGRIDGRVSSDSEWANTPSGNYESYVMDVVGDVDQRFATLACRQERAIAGLSAGAFGAANVGLHHDDAFGLIQVWSGYFTETHNGVFDHADKAVMAYNSPIDYVHTMDGTLRRFPMRIYIYGGQDDPDSAQIPTMAAALNAEGAHESWAIVPGGHSWGTWTPRVDQMLTMASRDFAEPLAAASPNCS
jgi:enterochelin esterase-like enzyme